MAAPGAASLGDLDAALADIGAAPRPPRALKRCTRSENLIRNFEVIVSDLGIPEGYDGFPPWLRSSHHEARRAADASSFNARSQVPDAAPRAQSSPEPGQAPPAPSSSDSLDVSQASSFSSEPGQASSDSLDASRCGSFEFAKHVRYAARGDAFDDDGGVGF